MTSSSTAQVRDAVGGMTNFRQPTARGLRWLCQDRHNGVAPGAVVVQFANRGRTSCGTLPAQIAS